MRAGVLLCLLAVHVAVAVGWLVGVVGSGPALAWVVCFMLWLHVANSRSVSEGDA